MNNPNIKFRLRIVLWLVLPLLFVPLLARLFGEVSIDSKFIFLWITISLLIILFVFFVYSPKFKKVEDLERPIKQKLKEIPDYRKLMLHTRIVAAIFLVLLFILLVLGERFLVSALILIGFILGVWRAKQNLKYSELLKETREIKEYRVAAGEAAKDSIKRALIATSILIILVIVLILFF